MDQTQAERLGKEPVGVVFIHGAGLTPNIWSQVESGLGVPSLKLHYPLPQGDRPSRRGLSLQDYVEGMKHQVEDWPVQRFVIVAHSLGGVIGLELAARLEGRVVGFVAVGAAIPKPGGSFLSIYPIGKRILMRALMQLFGTKPPESAIRQSLCHDLTRQQADEVVRAYVTESLRVYTDPRSAPKLQVPKLYVQLENDQEFTVPLQQQMSANLGAEESVVLASGHLPMLSQPERLREVLGKFMVRF